MRKITSILLISIISLVFMMGIINDKCVSVNASSLYDSELSYSETINLNKIVEKTLGLNNFDYEIIDGFNTQNKHVLVEGNNCYLIYDMVITEKVLFGGYQKKKCGILNLNLQPKN